MSEIVRNVSGVLSRADTLFGTAVSNGTATAAPDRLTDAADAIRAGQDQAATMSADTLTNYADFAQARRDALEELSGIETDLGQHLQEGAEAVTAAKAASRSALDMVTSASEAVEALSETPAAELAVIAALRAQVGNELELIHTHQAIAAQLGEQLRSLDY